MQNEDNATASSPAAIRRGKPTRMRLEVYEDEQSEFGKFLCALKERQIKDIDLPQMILEALEAVSEDWWKDKLEELTPLEYRVQTALEDPTMRERLEALLQDGSASH